MDYTHNYITDTVRANERKTLYVVFLTAAMMVVEIVAGLMFNSMALFADGWHMATHAGALSLAVFAYYFARAHATDPRFTFGTGKVTTLGGFASSVALGLIALLIMVESGVRLFGPQTIAFNEAILVAVIGLGVNIASAFLLKHDGHGHDHGHSHAPAAACDHDHDHDGHAHVHAHDGQDYNLKAAYMHVMADALTSVLAIAALLCGKYFGLTWMDALMGVVGGIIIAHWSFGLMRETSRILLDQMPDETLQQKIRGAICEGTDDKIEDLHVWEVAPGKYAVIIGVLTTGTNGFDHYARLLAKVDDFSHITVQVRNAA